MRPVDSPKIPTGQLRRDRLLRRIQLACAVLAAIGAVILIVSTRLAPRNSALGQNRPLGFHLRQSARQSPYKARCAIKATIGPAPRPPPPRGPPRVSPSKGARPASDRLTV